ncbi:hypothetical protein [Bacillus sp. FJAT-29814]|uniref:hypothetical protein n=1 Tax=Bacillus sp. FJAT-29814 TaxID=1729688 RepID=UPI0008303796|nr:hypothetical protein [Bacillus sp. FJAT-29814]
MKHVAMIFLAFMFVMAFHFAVSGSNLAFADDEHGENYKHEQRGEHEKEEGPYKEIGKTVGWGTVIAMGTAGIIFPLRRSVKAVITNFPTTKKPFISLSKFFGKYHIVFGIIALALGSIHGLTMYLSEGELEGGGLVGLGAVALMAFAGIFGAVLFKNKKRKTFRTAHTILITIAIILGLVHIIAA